jgi:hypothetical protein
LRQFRLGQIRFNALQEEVVAQGFGIDWNKLSAAKFLLGMVKNNL